MKRVPSKALYLSVVLWFMWILSTSVVHYTCFVKCFVPFANHKQCIYSLVLSKFIAFKSVFLIRKFIIPIS